MKYDVLKYDIKEDSILFWCSAVDENVAAAALLSDFVLDISSGKKVFFHAYRLPNEDIAEMIDPSVILARAGVLLDPFNTFLHLREAKIKINNFDWASSATIYYFENEVEWTDFLATSIIDKPIKLIKKGLLSARFTTADQGADYWFECHKSYEKKVLQLFEGMSNAGYKIQQSSRL